MSGLRGTRLFNYLYISLVLSVFTGCTPIAQLKNQPQEILKNFRNYERIKVSAIMSTWTNTNITVQADKDIIIIFATGKAANKSKKMKKEPWGKVLYYKIGSFGKKHPAIWENGIRAFKVIKSGKLKFSVRDERFDGIADENLGSYIVDVFVISKEKEHMIPALLKDLADANTDDQDFVENIESFIKKRSWYYAVAKTRTAIDKTKKEIKNIEKQIKVEVKESPIIENKKSLAKNTPTGKKEYKTEKGLHETIVDQKIDLKKSEESTKETVIAEDKQSARSKVDAELREQLAKLMKKLEHLENVKKEYETKMGNREAELLAKLESAKKRPPVAFIRTPQSDSRLEVDSVVFSGIVEDEKAINKIELLLNGKPIKEILSRAISLTKKDGPKKYEFRKRVDLAKGDNTLQIKAIDSDGLITIKQVNVKYVETRKNIWAAIIGIDNYLNVRHLKYASKDAQAFYDYLIKNIRVPKSNITILINEDANLTQMRSVLGTHLKRKAGKDDMVLIYFAGHGATEKDSMSPDGDGLEKYILPYDADPKDLYASALPMNEISKIFQRIQSDKLIFIADACYSGASGGRTIGVGGMRATVSDSFLDRIVSGKGRVIITASGSNEISAENDTLKHGVFTYYLLEGLGGKADSDKDGIITVDEAYSYVSRNVPLATEQNQHPVKKGSVEGQLVLGVVK